jgi:hypothetical protein
MTESSWPPRAEVPPSPEEPSSGPANPGTPESIGAVSSENTVVETDGEAVEPLDEGEEREPSEGGRRGLMTGLLIGGLVVMTALAATFLALWLGNSEPEADDVRAYLEQERDEIEETARAATDILINYDSTNIDARREEMLSISTGGFRADYEEVTSTLGGALQSAAASSTGSILDEPRISFVNPEEADAVMNVEQITQTRENPTGRTIAYILRVILVDTEDGWKVDNIEILSTGPS